MKRTTTILTLIMFSLVLIGCAAGRYPYPKTDLGVETWRSQVETDSNRWAMKADEWFLAGGETRAEIANQTASYDQTISRTSIRVPDFHSIKANGDYQIQITGDSENNRVWIEGPNNAVRSIAVHVNEDILCLDQVKGAPPEINQVIVHISMGNLNSLEHHGLGSVEGIRLASRCLIVEASGCGNIFLAGHLNVKRVIARGPGTVNIFTISSNGTEIETYNDGSVNFSAKRQVWLRSIKHKGSGDVNVIGASSNGLIVNAEGKGKIGISGLVNVREIRASGKTCVFIASSSSTAPCIYVYDDARVGIDGRAGSLNGYTSRTARLLARRLKVQNSYVRATGQSHMNVTAYNKMFASAYDYATIYFYGDPNILTAFKNQNGTIINMGTRSSPEKVIVPSEKPRQMRQACYINREPMIKVSQADKPTPPKFVWRRGRLTAVSDHQMYV